LTWYQNTLVFLPHPPHRGGFRKIYVFLPTQTASHLLRQRGPEGAYAKCKKEERRKREEDEVKKCAAGTHLQSKEAW
jgi:hypothetical protein